MKYYIDEKEVTEQEFKEVDHYDLIEESIPVIVKIQEKIKEIRQYTELPADFKD